jgi:hypothetical protein
LEQVCREGLGFTFPPVLPYQLVEAGYCDLIPEYLRILEDVYGPSSLLAPRLNFLHLALASKRCPDYQNMVVEFLESWLSAESALAPGFQASGCYVALSVIGSPRAQQIIREAAEGVDELPPPAQAALALALHFLGDSTRASDILDELIPKEFLLSEETIQGARAFIAADRGTREDVGLAARLRVFFELANTGWAGVGQDHWLIELTELCFSLTFAEAFGNPFSYHDIARLASMGYLVLTQDGGVKAMDLPFRGSLSRHEVEMNLYSYSRGVPTPVVPELVTPGVCRMVAALGDASQKPYLRAILESDGPRTVSIAAERGLIVLGEQLEPVIARRTVGARRREFAKAWIREHTTGLIARLLRREDTGRDTFDVVEECQYAIRALGDAGTPADVGLLAPIAMSRGGVYPQEARIAVINIIRRHKLSGPCVHGK